MEQSPAESQCLLETPENAREDVEKGEKLYVTADKRGEKVGCKRPLCWTMVALVVAAIVALIVLAATGILFSNSPTTVDQYNTTVSSARALGGIGLDHSSHDHSGHDHSDHDHSTHDHGTHDHSTHEHPEATQPPQQTGFQNDDGTIPVPSEDSGDSSVYVPRTVEGELKVDNEEYMTALSDPESDDYRQFENNFNEALKRALFDRDTIESGDEEIMVQIVDLRPGSVIVTYRIHWRSKTSSERTEDLLTPNALKTRLENYLEKNSRMISVYHIAEDKMATRSILDLCQINKNDCDHGCVFDEKTLDFICTCPRGQILDMNNSKKCMSIFETPDLEDMKQKEFRVLDIEATSVTRNPTPEEEKQVTDSVHVMENDNKFDWKEPTLVTTETITEKDPDLQFSHVFGHPGEKNQSNDSDNPTPEPTAEPNASYEHNVEPSPEPEPTSEPEPAVEPKPEPTSEPEPAAEPKPDPTSEPEPAAEPKPEPQTTPEPQPAVTFASFNVEKIAETTPEPEPTTESVTMPKTKCSAGESNSSGVCEELATQPEAQPEPEPEAEIKPAPEPEPEPKSTETETTSQSEQILNNMYTKTQENANEYKDINENMHYSQVNSEIQTTTTKSLQETTESTNDLHENIPTIPLLNILHITENNHSQGSIIITETTTESDWLEESPQVQKQNMNDTESEPRNIMDFINEHISIGESHETQERSFKTIDDQFMAATTTSTVSPTTTEDDISFDQFNKHEYALTSDTSTKTNDMRSSNTVKSITERTIEEEFKENPSDETTLVAILSSQESTIDNKTADTANKSNSSDLTYENESKGGKSNIISLIDGAKLFNMNNTMEVEVTTIYAVEPTTTTKYSISKQIEYEEEESLAHVLENHNSTETLTTTEKEPVDEGVDITFDTINMLYNRSSKSIENQNKSSEPTEPVDLKNIATTESDWLSESVTEVNYEEIMNKMEKHDTTEANFNKIEEIMNRGTNKDDFEPDYLNSLGTSKSPEPDEPLYGMIHDYDNEDSRVKRVNSEVKESTPAKKNATNTKIKIKDTAEGIKIEVFKGPPMETNTTPANVAEHLTEIIPPEEEQDDTTIFTSTTEKTIAVVSVKYSSEKEANNTTTDESSVVGTTNLSPADTLIRSEIMKNDTAIEAASPEKVSTENKTQETEISTENTSNIVSETTTVSQYIHKVAGETMQNQNYSMSSTVNNNEPAPVWEEHETEKEVMDSAMPNKSNVATITIEHQKFNRDDIILATTSTTLAPTPALALNKTTVVENNTDDTDSQSQNTTLVNVTIYEISKSNNSFPAVKSEDTHSTEYEDHETDMNPFLPEVENNKSLVKKLQEGHDLELASVNDTQNENSDDHTLHGSEKQASLSRKEVMRSTKEQEISAAADDNASLNDLTNESSSSEHEEINKNEEITNDSEVEQKDSISIKMREKSEEKILPISTFLFDTDDLEVGKEVTTELGSTVVEKDMEDSTNAATKAAEKSVMKFLSDPSSDLSVVPINEERNEEKEALKKSYKSENILEFNDISDSRKKSDRRTLDASQLESVINNEA